MMFSLICRAQTETDSEPHKVFLMSVFRGRTVMNSVDFLCIDPQSTLLETSGHRQQLLPCSACLHERTSRPRKQTTQSAHGIFCMICVVQ